MMLSERSRQRSMRLSLVSGGVGVFWFVVCLPQQVMALYVRNALGASPAVWGALAGTMQAAGLVNLLSIPLYARTSDRKAVWIWLTGLQRVSAFAVAAGAFAVAGGAPRTAGVTVTLTAGIVYTMLGAVAGTGWWAWMADLVPVRIRSGFFGRRSAIVQAVNVISLLLLTWTLDQVQGGRIFVFYGLLYALAGVLGTLDVLLHIPIPDPGDPAASRPRPGDLSLPWRDRRFRRFALAMGIGVVGVNLSGPFAAPYVTGMDGLGAPNFWIGITAAISQGAWVLTASFWGRVMDRLGKLPVLVIGALFPLSWAGYLIANPGNYIIVLPLLSLAGGLLASAYFDGMPQIVNALSEKGSRTAYMAWYWTVFSAAGAAGPVLGGLVIEAADLAGLNGFRTVVVMTLALALAGSFLMTLVRLPEAPVGSTLPAIVSPSVLRNYGWTGIIERPEQANRVGRALRSLEGRSARMAIPGVHERLDDPDPDVREEAVRSLGRFGGPDDIPALAARLENPNSTVRVSAARALGFIGHPDTVPHLLRTLADPSEDLREACAAALGRTGSPFAQSALIELLNGGDTERVKVAAAMALSRAGETRAVADIHRLRSRTVSPVLCRQLAVALADLIGPPGGFYRYLPGTADTAGTGGPEKMFRRAAVHVRHLRRKGQFPAVSGAAAPPVEEEFEKAAQGFDDADFPTAVYLLDRLAERLYPATASHGPDEVSAAAAGRKAPAHSTVKVTRDSGSVPGGPPGRLLVRLIASDAASGKSLGAEDVLLAVWFLMTCEAKST